jgi:arylformamidase
MAESSTIRDDGRSSELERQYDFRWRHPDRDVILARYTAESERVLAEGPALLDLAYGAGARARLDVFPAPEPGRPIHVFIHGGYWRAHRKEDYRFVARAAREARAATIVIEYDLAPQVALDEIIEQVRRALLWISRNAREWNGDAGHLVVSGHSAGGHLAAMMALTDWTAYGVPAGLVRGCLALSGVFDLDPITRTSINDDLRLDASAVRRNSPINHVGQSRALIAVAYGVDETDEFARQSQAFAAALEVAGGSAPLLALPGLHHYNIVLELARGDSALAIALRTLLGDDG